MYKSCKTIKPPEMVKSDNKGRYYFLWLCCCKHSSGISLKIISCFLLLFPSNLFLLSFSTFSYLWIFHCPHFPSCLFPAFKPEITYLFTSQLAYSPAFFTWQLRAVKRNTTKQLLAASHHSLSTSNFVGPSK